MLKQTLEQTSRKNLLVTNRYNLKPIFKRLEKSTSKPVTIQDLQAEIHNIKKEIKEIKEQQTIYNAKLSNLEENSDQEVIPETELENKEEFGDFPNKPVSLLDRNILDSLFLNIRLHGLNMKDGSFPAALLYRIQYKVMNTCNSIVLLKTTDMETTLFVTDMAKLNVTIPRLIKWDEVDLPTSWLLDRATPSAPRHTLELQEIRQTETRKVEFIFDRRNSFSSRFEATRSEYSYARRFFSIASQHTHQGSSSRIITPETNLQGIETINSIPRPVYQQNEDEDHRSIQSPTYSSLNEPYDTI